MRIQWIVSATYALFHSCSSAFSRSIKIGGSFCVVAPYHYRVRCDFSCLIALPTFPYASGVPCARIWAATPPLPKSVVLARGAASTVTLLSVRTPEFLLCSFYALARSESLFALPPRIHPSMSIVPPVLCCLCSKSVPFPYTSKRKEPNQKLAKLLIWEEEARQLHLLRSNLIVDRRFWRRDPATLGIGYIQVHILCPRLNAAFDDRYGTLLYRLFIRSMFLLQNEDLLGFCAK